MSNLHIHLSDLAGSAATVAFTVLRTATTYVALLAALRLTGRRHLGQVTPFDLVTLLLLSNSVQNAMIGPDNSLTGGIAAALTLLATNRLVARNSWARSRLEGSPVLLVHRGQIDEAQLQRHSIGLDELMTSVREHGIGSIAGVESAILEMDGTISVIPAEKVIVHHLRKVRSTRNR